MDGFNKILNPDEIQRLTKNAGILSMGPSATRELKAAGLEVTHEAVEHTIPGIIDYLMNRFKTSKINTESSKQKRQTL